MDLYLNDRCDKMTWYQANNYPYMSQNYNVQPISLGYGSLNQVSHGNYNPGFPSGNYYSPMQSFCPQQQKSLDTDVINSFVKNKGSTLRRKQVTSLSISEAKSHLVQAISLKKQLEVVVSELEKADQDFECKWETAIAAECKINNHLSQFNDEVLTSLKKQLCKRYKKRKRNQKQMEVLKDQKMDAAAKRKQKHDVIDKVINEKLKDVERIKREEAVKRQADAVLHDVRKRKFEAKKMLNMLKALSKLRELRGEQEVSRGGYCSKEVAETFNKVLNNLHELWTKQASVYQLEEKGLKVLLEDNLPETKQSEFQSILLEWEYVLFGNVAENENFNFLTQAETSMESFIQTRRDWDQFLSNTSTIMSSNIPSGWIIPDELQSDWKPFIRTKRKP